jgi:hypothetical protein
VPIVTSNGTSRGRHRLPEPVGRPALLPRSAGVVAATVGAVLVLTAQERPTSVAPGLHPDTPGLSALEPVVLAPRDAPAPVPIGVTGRALASVHLSGAAAVRAAEPYAGVIPA